MRSTVSCPDGLNAQHMVRACPGLRRARLPTFTCGEGADATDHARHDEAQLGTVQWRPPLKKVSTAFFHFCLRRSIPACSLHTCTPTYAPRHGFSAFGPVAPKRPAAQDAGIRLKLTFASAVESPELNSSRLPIFICTCTTCTTRTPIIIITTRSPSSTHCQPESPLPLRLHICPISSKQKKS